jgi:general secretion pathway protein G
MQRGFTVLQMIIATAVVSFLLSMSFPAWLTARNKTRYERAEAEVHAIAMAQEAVYATFHRYTANLSDLVSITAPVGFHAGLWNGPYVHCPITDPWGRPYVYALDAGTAAESVFAAHEYTVDPDGYTISGDSDINPSNKEEDAFELHTPSGVIDRETLLHEGADFTYNGPATSLYVKPQSTGRTLVVNGISCTLDTSSRYTIGSPTMTVYLRNTHEQGNPMGHWWIQIAGANATISPAPDGLPGPELHTSTFGATPGVGTLTVVNEAPAVTSGWVRLNGSEVVPTSLLASKTTPLTLTVDLQASNTLEICVADPPGATMTVAVTQDVQTSRDDRYTLVCYGKDGLPGGEGFDRDIVP